ncbi:MAG: hypothetical protein AABY15_00450 [Nanoarchaeota archaeon]
MDSVRKIVREILRESFDQLSEIDWEGEFSDVKQVCINPEDIVDYLNRVRANAPLSTAEREKFKMNEPFVHAKSTFFNPQKTTVDIDYFIKNMTAAPQTIINTNDKILKSGGPYEYVFKTGIPAYRGIVYDEKNGTFHYINTCPGAGACAVICYAMKGQYIQYPTSYDSMTRRLNYLLNNPDKYEEQMYQELKAKALEYKALKGYKPKIVLRWNDSGDFFANRYVKIAENVMKRLNDEGYNVTGYAYTKMADVAKSSDIDTTFSVGGSKGQASKIDLTKHKKSEIIPTKIVKGLDFDKIDDEIVLKDRVAKHFGIDKKYLITYDEMMTAPKGDEPIWSVIVTPRDGDDAAFRKDVKAIYLTQH